MKVPFARAFCNILNFHLKDGDKIIDMTYGEGYSWKQYHSDNRMTQFGFRRRKVYDLSIYKGDVYKYKERKDVMYNAVYFDPPYFFEANASKDARSVEYNINGFLRVDIEKLIRFANKMFPTILRKDGLVFFKYADNFSVKRKEYSFGPLLWLPLFTNFDVVDNYIIPHHHIKPTAWQVKNRGCSISAYSYLTVLRMRKCKE